MHIFYRRIIALIFIAAFCVMAPLLILYTAGYRYNFKKNEIQKTGSLVIKSTPFWANVAINGRNINQRTPVRLNNIIPDEYEISVSKTGYYPWTKKLTVKSQETTFAEDIVLFAESRPREIVAEKIQWISFSPAKQSAVYALNEFGQDYLYLLNLAGGRTSLLYHNGARLADHRIIWSRDGARFLLDEGARRTVISATLPKYSLDITPFAKSNSLTEFKWAGHDSNLLYAMAGNQIFEYNVLTQSWRRIFKLEKKERLMDFLIRDGVIYTIEEFGAVSLLAKYPLDPAQPAIYKTLELSSREYRFEWDFENKLGLREAKSGAYYLVNNELDNIQFSRQDVNSTEWHAARRYLLAANPQELAFLDFANNLAEKNITRYSGSLTKALWHESANYAYALQDGRIRIIELDDRSGHFTLELPLEGITDFGVDGRDHYLYYLKDGRLFQLEI